MAIRRHLRLLRLLALPLFLGGCQTLQLGPPEIPEAELERQGPSLALIAAELQMHLRDDTYRHDRAVDADGRNVFALALWRLDRLKRVRAGEMSDNADIVIEYARGRAFERLRRYPEALAAYEQVVGRASVLEGAAEEARQVIGRFARHSGPPAQPPATPEEELQLIETRIEKWTDLAWEYRGTSYAPLAREELEAWEMLRVEWFARAGRLEPAIEAGRRLIERHHESKLYASHLLRLGDLYARAARDEHLRFRANAAPFDARRYEWLLDQAFSAYELAAAQHRPWAEREAKNKIGALLAYHEEVRADVP